MMNTNQLESDFVLYAASDALIFSGVEKNSDENGCHGNHGFIKMELPVGIKWPLFILTVT